MILKMAFKNLFAHKTKTIITLSLISIGTFLIILGLGILNFALQQTKNVCISDFSGDILITGKPEKAGVNIELLGASQNVQMGMNRPKMPYLGKFQKLEEKLKSINEIKTFTPSVVSGGNMLTPLNLDGNWKAKPENQSFFPYVKILGIQPESYKKVFQTIKVYDGSFNEKNDEPFFLIPKEEKENYEKYYETKLKVGDEIMVNAFGLKSRMQKVKITGFFEYAHPETAISSIAYSNVATCRQLAGMTMGAKTAVEIPKSVNLDLADMSEEDLFADDSDMFESETEISNEEISKDSLENILGSTELRDSLNMPDADAWNHIAIRLKDPRDTASVIAMLNKWFADEELELQALTWDKAMYSYAEAIETGKNILTTALILLSVVVLIVIMNTLVVSVMERTSEIGTMRAIGAKKKFVKKIFYAESFVMSLSGVVLGIALAFIASAIFNSLDIRLNKVMAILFGGYFVQVKISAMAIVGTTFSMLLAGLLANIYPIRLALRISPLEAINK